MSNKSTQWKPGQSGNPAGKPPGTKSFKTDFDEVVEEIAKQNNITASEARKILLKKAFAEAKNGNFPFYKDIADRYYGKPVDNMDITSGGKPIPLFDRTQKNALQYHNSNSTNPTFEEED